MNTTIPERWEQLYDQTPLCDVPRHFAGMRRSPFLQEYLAEVLRRCPRGGRTLETGVGSGYGAVWLSLRGVQAEGLDYAPRIVERACQVNNVLEGRAAFREGDLFRLYENLSRPHGGPDGPGRYDVVHHQGVLEHLSVPHIRAALAQQVACADWVVFSVPSVFYPFESEFGDERLLRLEDWQRILLPFDVADLRYYGDPQLGGREHVLGVLRGQPADDRLRALMAVPDEPYPEGISAVVHTRNEARHIADCLETLRGWTDEIIVCDMESEDETVSIAHRYTEDIFTHPLIPHFDRARNVSGMRAKYRWVFYLDADERVPPGLGPHLRALVTAQGDAFEGLLLPFCHHFAGRWMQSLYPGYTAPRLLKNGRFVFNARLHSGVEVDGRVARFPAGDPALALTHFSFDSLSHYLEKLNRYTDGEAQSLHRDGRPFHWQEAVRAFVQDFRAYYDQGDGGRDGVHGFLYAFLSGFYRFEQHAKLYERRFRAGQLQSAERAIPDTVEEVLEYALAVARHRPLPPPAPVRVDRAAPEAAGVVWSGPLHDPSGYGEESRNFLFALEDAGVPVAAQVLPWSHDTVDLSDAERARLERAQGRPAAPGFLHVTQNFPPAWGRHPEAGLAVGRTMFETDRLPPDWVQACNRMDAVWVPSEFNRRTFAQAGVETGKLAVVPGCFDQAPFTQDEPLGADRAVIEGVAARGEFVFLSVFDWTRHKGWDVLLRAFLEAFEGRTDVRLVLKAWSTLGYGAGGIREQAAAFVSRELGHDLLSDPRVAFLPERLTRPGLRALYRACDAFVLPSRGEGWGRPYMEAMACGRPVIGTNWSGNTAFMTGANSYLLDCEVRAVPEEGWREIPTYRGHRWAEPDARHLAELMRRVVAEPGEAAAKGAQAREDVFSRFNRARVGRLVACEIARLREEARPHPVLVGT